MKSALTIAGSDSGCGAGVQADLLTFASCGVFGLCAFTSLTAQNPNAVSAVKEVGVDFFNAQLESVNYYFKPVAAKTGMLYSTEIVQACVQFFEKNLQIKYVCDPVMISTSGAKLLKDDAIDALVNKLSPLALLITPNLDEAKFILDCDEINRENISEKALCLVEKLKANVLLKGGHLEGGKTLLDVLATRDGKTYIYESERIENVNTHGSGCTLSSAIASFLALGFGLKESVENARNYLAMALKKPLTIANENFINHFPNK